MSLKTKSRKSKAVFDFPQKPVAKKQFTIRRFLSLAGKSVLAQRNQPIQINRNTVYQKCFSLSHIFKFSPRSQAKAYFWRALIKSNALQKSFDFNHKLYETKSQRLPLQKQRLLPAQKTKIVVTKRRIFFCRLAQQSFKLEIYNFKPGAENFAFPDAKFKTYKGKYSFSPENIENADINPATTPGALKSNNARLQPSLNCRYKFNKIAAPCHFMAINDNFFLYPPAAANFQLSPQIQSDNQAGSYIAEKKCNFICNRFINSLKEIKSGSFDCRPEIGKNLVIEVKQKFKARPGKLKALKAICSPAENMPKATKKNVPALAGEKIVSEKLLLQGHSVSNFPALTVKRCRINTVLNLSGLPADKQKQEIKISPEMSKAKPLFKLKLRLRRFAFSKISSNFSLFSSISFSPLYKSTVLLTPHTNIKFKTVQANYRPDFMQLCIEKKSLEKFCKKRLLLRFSTRTQARFVKHIMRKIAFADLAVRALLKCRFSLEGSLKSCSPKIAKFAGKSERFNDFIGILGRPKPLLMTLTQLNLTDIVLPLRRRRLKAPEGFHQLKNFNKLLSASKTTFRNYELDTDKNLTDFAVKRLRHIRIENRIKELAILPATRTLIKCRAPALASAQLQLRQTLPDIRPILEYCRTLERIPDSACPSLKLNLDIIAAGFSRQLKQPSFIAPPPWEKLNRKFNCRLRLLPYPFGFPGFKKKAEKMLTTCSFVSFSPSSFKDLPIRIQAFYCSLKNKAFRSKYSLKAPQKWLFTKTAHEEQLTQKLAYRFAITSSFANCFCRPENITGFAFSWQNASKSFTHLATEFNFNKGLLSKKQLEFISFMESQKHLPEKFISPPKAIMWSGYQKIARLLLSNIVLDAKASQVKSLPFFARSIKQKDVALKSFKQPLLPKLFTFMEPKNESQISYSEVLGFYQELPEVKSPLLSLKSVFKSRIRQFFFPYYPEIKTPDTGQTSYFCLDDTSQIQSCNEIEELRANQITEPLTTSINLSLNFLQNLKKKEVVDDSKFRFAAESRKASIPFRLITRQQRSGRLPLTDKLLTLHKKPLSKSLCPLHYSPKPFFRKASLPAPTFKQPKTQLKIKISSPQRIENSFPDRLILDTTHWVILLKSFMKSGNEKLNFIVNLINRKKNLPLKHFAKNINFREVWLSKSADYTSILALSLPERPQFFVQARLQYSDISLNYSAVNFLHTPNPEIETFSQISLPGLPAFSESKLTEESQLLPNKTDLKIATHKDESPAFASLEFALKKKSPAERLKITLKHKKLRPMKSSFHFSYIPEWLDIEFSQRNADTKPGQLTFFAGSVKNASNVDLSLQRN